MKHVIYLKLGQKLLLKAEKIHKTATTYFQTWRKQVLIAQLVTTIIFVSAWDKSRDLWVNSQKLIEIWSSIVKLI